MSSHSAKIPNKTRYEIRDDDNKIKICKITKNIFEIILSNISIIFIFALNKKKISHSSFIISVFISF